MSDQMLSPKGTVVVSHKTRVAYLVTHPIQYQAPLLRRIAQEHDIEFKCFFCSDVSVSQFSDVDFGKRVKWDIPLLDGYCHEFLPSLGQTDLISFWRPFNYGLTARLRAGQFDVLWVHGYARWFHWIAMLIAKLRGMKILIRDEATLISTQRNILKRIAKQAFFLGLRKLCDGFLAIGSLNREYYLAYGIEEAKIFSMPYAVDNGFFRAEAVSALPCRGQFRAAHGLDSTRPVILFAGKIIARKRAGDLVEAYIRLSSDGKTEPEPYLLIVGDGRERLSLERRIAKLGWKSVHFLGFKNQSELPRYYDLCNVFVLPSVDEPWGLVINEVMNAGRAVIISDRVGCGPDLVRNGQNGYVFKASNVDDLCRVLRLALENAERCREMGEKSLGLISGWGFEEDISGLKQALNYVTKSQRSQLNAG